MFISRLGSRQILDRVFRNDGLRMSALVRPITLKARPAQPRAKMGYDERNMRINRPQSPHLTIYAAELTSMLSMTHRLTGLALAGYAIILGTGTLVLPDTIPHYIDALSDAECLGPVSLFISKLIIALPASYHCWNGVRHLCWDLGMFLSLKKVYATAYVMLILATSTAVTLAAL